MNYLKTRHTYVVSDDIHCYFMYPVHGEHVLVGLRLEDPVHSYIHVFDREEDMVECLLDILDDGEHNEADFGEAYVGKCRDCRKFFRSADMTDGFCEACHEYATRIDGFTACRCGKTSMSCTCDADFDMHRDNELEKL